MRRRIITLATLSVMALLALPNAVQAQSPNLMPVQYMVNFVCGFVPPPTPGQEIPPVKPGNYATAININNYLAGFGADPEYLFVSFRVQLHYRGFPAPGPPWTSFPPPPVPAFRYRRFVAYRYRVLELDCTDIWAIAGDPPNGVPPDTFLKGMVHIGTTAVLPVAATYTAELTLDPQQPPNVGAGISIDVEYVPPLIDLTGTP